MTTYARGPKDVLDFVAEVMKKFHDDLHKAGIKVEMLMAFPPVDKDGEVTGPALKHDGHPCAALASIKNLKERVATGFDTRIELDNDIWAESDDETRAAIIDHEMCHWQLCLNDKGIVKTDEADRPKITKIEHDYQFGWFAVVARRHGQYSIEVQQAQRLLKSETWRQCWIPSMEPASTMK